jgi:tripartite-type tricarboxylate transporter receptor subunit TctC
VRNLLLTLPLVAGYDLVASTWFALAGPKGLPNEIVQRLNQNNGMKK